MQYFYAMAVVLILVAVLFVFVPVIRFKTKQSTVVNSAKWFSSRQEELKQELASGQLSQERYEQALVELKVRAAEELSIEEQKFDDSNKSVKKQAWAVSVVLMLISGIAMYSQFGGHSQMQFWEESMTQLPDLAKGIVEQEERNYSPQELTRLALGLRTSLVEKGDDPIGWMLYGRVLLTLQDMQGGIDALDKARALDPDRYEINTSLVQALLSVDDASGWDRALRIVINTLRSYPQDELSLILYSVANMQLDKHMDARNGLITLQSKLSPEDPRNAWVNEQLAVVNGKLAPQTQDQTLDILVTLAPGMENIASDFSYLFVFARTSAMPMPIAVKKIPVQSFPVQLTLSDADGIMPTMKLSTQEKVTLVARLSKDGDAAKSEGELETVLAEVSTAHKGIINLVIAQE